ncbi:gene related to expression site-associated gene 2 (GRESAG2), putative [Trypanosoma brucei brucei TREU927]|uniref:Gene related to expression site-associated gene 2 (GRESAG2), putative n=1 Tax=Trypanosoma brucei brucei (strain 927/4 GUTat10.1) TaxID=185431 RepID=Q581G2_TRYB2|nr:gene related to expression site-associated gene 2 (GRESAG2), putative [Trypanosoma brucei brucei TREU927]AAX79588.1 gene related to expression site-associated gene 2 (GRESAG2), putative [Trypanosoma brucei]AAZ11618.1 gene related to expression site-associated gene 2 (GRESAG2), putative [Trypanosoma brucei brucei TREU927]
MMHELVFIIGLFVAVLSVSSQSDLSRHNWSIISRNRSVFTKLVSELNNHHSIGEFEALCKIYRITQAETPKSSFKNREKEAEILKKLEEMVSETEAVGGDKGSSKLGKRTTAYQEIKILLEKAKKLKEEIEVNRTRSLNASRSAEENMLRAVYGDAVDVARNENKTLEEAMRGNKSLLFNSVDHANMSCGSYGDKLVGKTLINDFFCLCVGEAIDVQIRSNMFSGLELSSNYHPVYNGFNCPCKDEIRRPQNGSWTMMADYCPSNYNTCDPRKVKYNHTEAWDVISKACVYKNVASNVKTLKSALAQFDALVNLEQDNYQMKGILGYADISENTNRTCNGHTAGFTCVSYNYTLENGGIPWYNRLTNATKELQEMAKYAKEADSHLHELEEYQHEAEEIYLEVKLGGDAELWKSSRGKGYSGGDDTDVNNDGLNYINITTDFLILLFSSFICIS